MLRASAPGSRFTSGRRATSTTPTMPSARSGRTTSPSYQEQNPVTWPPWGSSPAAGPMLYWLPGKRHGDHHRWTQM